MLNRLLKRGGKPATPNRKGVPVEAFRYEFDLFSSCSCTQAKRMRALHGARKLVPEKVPGPNDGEENTYFAVCRSFAHLGPLWAELDARRDVLNRHLPSRALSHQSPLQAYPQAIHSGRFYRPEWEEEFLSLEKVYTYLAQCRWVRSIRPNGSFELGSYYYYMGRRFARRSVAISFDPGSAALLCQSEGSEETLQLPVQGLTKAELMGELAALQALPIYQLALPFSLEAWRQLEYTRILTGTTL